MLSAAERIELKTSPYSLSGIEQRLKLCWEALDALRQLRTDSVAQTRRRTRLIQKCLHTIGDLERRRSLIRTGDELEKRIKSATTEAEPPEYRWPDPDESPGDSDASMAFWYSHLQLWVLFLSAVEEFHPVAEGRKLAATLRELYQREYTQAACEYEQAAFEKLPAPPEPKEDKSDDEASNQSEPGFPCPPNSGWARYNPLLISQDAYLKLIEREARGAIEASPYLASPEASNRTAFVKLAVERAKAYCRSVEEYLESNRFKRMADWPRLKRDIEWTVLNQILGREAHEIAKDYHVEPAAVRSAVIRMLKRLDPHHLLIPKRPGKRGSPQESK